MRRLPSRRLISSVLLLGALLALAAWGCLPEEKAPGSDGQEDAIEFDASATVVDEDLVPLTTATYTVHAGASAAPETRSVDGEGKFRISGLTGPVLVIIEAPGCLPEPLVVDSGASRTPVRVRMLRAAGSGGERRIVMHFAGDVMLGRRYLEPTSEVSAVVTPGDGGASARRVVDSIAPLFTAAHVRSLNLETVIGTFPREAAYPKKRFLLQSPPEIVSLLDELQASFVTLGNNHARDWLDPGVESITQVLDEEGVPHVGAGMNPAEAGETLLVDAAGYKIGLLSYTTVNGDFVNDSLPLDDAIPPNPLPASEAWQYEFRMFGYAEGSILITEDLRRVGEVWLRFKVAEESGATETEIADLWGQLVLVYPELQDWVARRGHGGANPYDFSQIAADIASLNDDDNCDLVVVQFHGGFQFFELKSEALQAAAKKAIDGDADLVVCHHPHVLQGFEWYQGKLIAYSLGNFVFDQDFLSTFPSAVLRVVFEDLVIIEARVYPIVLENYRPVPLGGTAALTVLQALHERSVLPLRSERIEGSVRNVLRVPDPVFTPAQVIVERSTGRIEMGSAPVETIPISAGPGAILDLVPPSLTRSRGPGGASLPNILLGRDLFHWGTFEDDTADGLAHGGTHWLTNNTSRRIHSLPEAPSGVRCLRLRRTGDNTTRTRLRPVARIPMTHNRIYEQPIFDGSAFPVDGEATYTLRMWARLKGTGNPHVQLDLYHFDDTNPTEDPESVKLGVEEVTVRVPSDDVWHEVAIDFPADFLESVGGLEPNAVLLYVGLDPPDSGESIFLCDELQLIEWREASILPDAFYAMDALRSADGSAITVDIERTAP